MFKAKGLRLLTLAGIFCASHAIVASAQSQSGLGLQSFGFRGGATFDPDQVHFGAHINAGNFFKNVRFQPNFELGFGNDATIGAINVDVLYIVEGTDWHPYFGGGLGIALVDFKDNFSTEAGLNLAGGIEWGPEFRYMVEGRVGIGDVPDFKITGGISF